MKLAKHTVKSNILSSKIFISNNIGKPCINLPISTIYLILKQGNLDLTQYYDAGNHH